MTGNVARPLQPTDPRRLGSYQVIGRLGQGGMGTVFLGRAADGSAVAIKVIRPELAQRPEFRARFAREAESARRVRRFTTAAVLDADPHGPQPYLVTEFVEGPTLSRHVAVRGPMRPADLEQLAVSVTTALSAIHAAGIVHRDLTPGNVLLSPVGPKVIDFGLAREYDADTELSRHVRQAIGTPGYMSPEQILDAPITSAVDIFSWGAVMVFAASGQPPFGSGRTEAVLYRIVNEPPRLDGLGGELRGLVESAMAKDPAARPTAEELRTALIGGGTLPARTTSVPSMDSAPTVTSSVIPAATPAEGSRRWGRRGRGTVPDVPATSAGPPPMPTTQVSPAPIAAPPPVLARTPPPSGTPSGTPPPDPGIGSVPPHRQPSTARADPGPVGAVPGSATGRAASGPAGTPAPAPARRRRLRPTLIVAGFVVLLAAAVAVPFVVLNGDDAKAPASAADRRSVSARLAADAAAQRARDPALAARLSLAAYRIAPTADARNAMIASFTRSTAVRVPAGPVAYSDLAISADGRTLAGTDDAGRLHIWTLDEAGRPTAAAPGTADDHAQGVVFDGAGTWLATGGKTDAGRLWDITDRTHPRPLGALDPQSTPVQRLALSTNAHLLVTAGIDWSVGLWDVTDPGRPASLQLLIGRSGPVTDVALRPDGAVLAIAGVGGAVQLWNVRNPHDPVQLGSVPGHIGAVNTVAFSPDGRLLATGGDDQLVQVSEVGDPHHPRVVHRLTGSTAPVAAVAFTDDAHLVSTDTGGTVGYWNLTAGPPRILPLNTLGAPPRAMSVTTAGTIALTTDKGGILVESVDPDRLRRLACTRPGAAMGRAEWARRVPGRPYSDSCSR